MTFSTSVTPNDPKSKFESISFVKGLKLVNIPESRDPAMWHVGGVAFSIKAKFFDIFDPCGPYLTFEVKLLITFVALYPLMILTKFGWNPMKLVEEEEANCEKSCKNKSTTS